MLWNYGSSDHTRCTVFNLFAVQSGSFWNSAREMEPFFHQAVSDFCCPCAALGFFTSFDLWTTLNTRVLAFPFVPSFLHPASLEYRVIAIQAWLHTPTLSESIPWLIWAHQPWFCNVWMARASPSPSLRQAWAILPCVVRSTTSLQHRVATLYTWNFGRHNCPSWSQACCKFFHFDSMKARLRNAGKIEPYPPRGSRSWGAPLRVSCSAADGTFFFLALKNKKNVILRVPYIALRFSCVRTYIFI